MTHHQLKYRLGLDVGTNSLGWSVLELNEENEPVEIIGAGSRIFSDGRDSKSKATLAADRRDARSARRRRDRYKQRRTHLLEALTEAGLFPEENDKAARQALQKLNPLELRARLLTKTAADILADIKTRPDEAGKALNAAASVKPEYLIGRALFHLNQRRGFQSNRKDRSEETTSGKVSGSVRMLMQEMQLIDPPLPPEEYKELSQEDKKAARQAEAEARKEALSKLAAQKDRTFGSFLWQRQQDGEQTRARPGAGDDGKLYDVYPTRDMYEDEFNKIWDAQAGHFPQQMGDKAHFHKIIFTQRPLKPQKRGKCTYMPEHDRTFRAMPSFQRFRIYQEINNLEWTTAEGKHYLTNYPEARDAIIDLLEKPEPKKTGEIATNKPILWGKMKTVLEKLGIAEGNFQFNFETPKRKGFDGNQTSNIMQHEDYVGPDWHKWDLEKQDRFIDVILDDELDDEEVKGHLKSQYGLDENAAEKCMNAQLVEGTASVSKEAAWLMLEKMRDGIKTENGLILPLQSDAAEEIAEERNDFVNPMRRPKTDEADFEPLPHLPYYGEAFQDGRHIIPGDRMPEDEGDDRKFYGGVTNPTVHIALNQIRQVVNELIDRFGHPHSISIELGRELPEGENYRGGLDRTQAANQERNQKYNDRLRDKLGKEPTKLNRELLRLREEQDKRCPYCLGRIELPDLFEGGIDIDHILPRKTLDDSLANKVVSHRECNHFKSDQTPWEAFHNGFKGKRWKEIYENAAYIKYEVQYFNRKARNRDGTKGKWETDKISKQWRFQENAMALQQGDRDEIRQAAKKMATSESPAVKGIAEKIMRNGVASLSPKEKIIAEKHRIPSKEFSDRHLNDTRYIGRLTREYLENICHIDKINVVTGKHTSMLRSHWGLNSILKKLHDKAEHSRDHNQPEGEQEEKSSKKNRDDHRHHAIDAIVIGMITKGMVNRISRAAAEKEKQNQQMREAIMKRGHASEEQMESLIRIFPKNKQGHSDIDPWDGFREDVKDAARKIIVSHKARKKKLQPGETTDGQLHNETAFGLIEPVNEAKNEWKTVVRRPIDYFTTGISNWTKSKTLNHLQDIRDTKLKEKFLAAFEASEDRGKKEIFAAIDACAEKNGTNGNKIRRLRCFGPKQAIPIRDKSGNIYKGYQGDSNWGMEIYSFPEGHKKADKWEGVVISRFDANKPGFQPGTTYRPHPAACLVMRLQINDCIEIEENGVKRRVTLKEVHTSGKMILAPLNEANTNKRDSNKNVIGEYKNFAFVGKAIGKGKNKRIEIAELGDKKKVKVLVDDPELKWQYEDTFQYLRVGAFSDRKGANSLYKLKARKVHISPTGQVNYESRRKRRKKG